MTKISCVHGTIKCLDKREPSTRFRSIKEEEVGRSYVRMRLDETSSVTVVDVRDRCPYTTRPKNDPHVALQQSKTHKTKPTAGV